MDEVNEKRIREIDDRIKDLEEHKTMWGKAGGMGGRMAMEALSEIDDLRLEKEDLLNGTRKLERKRIEKRIKQLELLKKEAGFFKRMKYNTLLKQKNAELTRMIEDSSDNTQEIKNNLQK